MDDAILEVLSRRITWLGCLDKFVHLTKPLGPWKSSALRPAPFRIGRVAREHATSTGQCGCAATNTGAGLGSQKTSSLQQICRFLNQHCRIPLFRPGRVFSRFSQRRQVGASRRRQVRTPLCKAGIQAPSIKAAGMPVIFFSQGNDAWTETSATSLLGLAATISDHQVFVMARLRGVDSARLPGIVRARTIRIVPHVLQTTVQRRGRVSCMPAGSVTLTVSSVETAETPKLLPEIVHAMKRSAVCEGRILQLLSRLANNPVRQVILRCPA